MRYSVTERIWQVLWSQASRLGLAYQGVSHRLRHAKKEVVPGDVYMQDFLHSKRVNGPSRSQEILDCINVQSLFVCVLCKVLSCENWSVAD